MKRKKIIALQPKTKGWQSKKLHMQGAQNLRSEAYLPALPYFILAVKPLTCQEIFGAGAGLLKSSPNFSKFFLTARKKEHNVSKYANMTG
jgi:hypothetical protein